MTDKIDPEDVLEGCLVLAVYSFIGVVMLSFVLRICYEIITGAN